jgi:mannose-1-phosphate guanylyltransferase
MTGWGGMGEGPSLHVLILAGGVGTRFWPASTPARPKQLLALSSERPLIVDTVERALKVADRDRIRILTGAHLVPPFQAALPQLPDSAYWVEPRARGTGPVLAWAAHQVAARDPDGILISLHADHLIDPDEALSALLPRAAALAADEDLLLTLAVPPDRPETGYGWIRPGAPIRDEAGLRAWRVGAFVEKPDLPTAERYLRGGYLWNSGIFVWSARRFLEEVRLHAPEIAPHLAHLDRGDVEAYFQEVSPISVDEAVLERSGRVGTVEATFRWDDVGSWASLSRARSGDEAGNVTVGETHPVQAGGNVVWAEDGPVVLFGVDDLVVVRTGGITVVARKDRSPDWKELVARLPERLREGGFGSADASGDDA